MKWLILVMLMGCGKVEMPKAIDMHDADGDQIPNGREVNGNKFIADFVPVGEISGQLSFRAGDLVKREIFLKVTNARNLRQESLDLLTRPESKHLPADFSSEWSRISIEAPKVLPEMESRLYEISLSFIPSEVKPDFVLLINGKTNIRVGNFQDKMTFKLESSDLVSLMKNESYLAFGKRTMVQPYADSLAIQETIREKTYRIFYHDGSMGKIFYVSKDYSFDDFLKFKGIAKAIHFSMIDAFQYTNREDEWFFRHLPQGDKVLVKTGSAHLLPAYLKNFQKTEMNLKRDNGKTANSLKLKKADHSPVHIKFRASQTNRSFREYVEKVRHSIGGGREGSPSEWHCMNYYRIIENEINTPVPVDDFLTNIMIRFNNSQYALAELDHEISQKEDEFGQYLLLSFNLHTESLEVYLETKPNNTYVSTGCYDLQCDRGEAVRGKISVVPTNIEGHLTLAMEAYVEKMD